MDDLKTLPARRRPVASTRAPQARPRLAPTLILIGASTGGPQALIAVIKDLVGVIPRVPVCVSLHMPADLMPVMAAHVARVCNVVAHVVVQPMPLTAGIVYFASGDDHCGFELSRPGGQGRAGRGIRRGPVPTGGRRHVQLRRRQPRIPRARHRPLRHGQGWSQRCPRDRRGRGCVLVQDKASSAVWGMPGVIAKADLASAILDPKGLAADVVRRLQPVLGAA